jgi:hypothetical protein
MRGHPYCSGSPASANLFRPEIRDADRTEKLLQGICVDPQQKAPGDAVAPVAIALNIEARMRERPVPKINSISAVLQLGRTLPSASTF